jgi:hypothetical protein
MTFFLPSPALVLARWMYGVLASLPLVFHPVSSHGEHAAAPAPAVQPKSGPQRGSEHAPHSGAETPQEIRHQANALVRFFAQFSSEEAPPAQIIPGDYSHLPRQPQVQYATESVQVSNKSKYALDVLIRLRSETKEHGEHLEVQRFESSESQAFSRTSTQMLEAFAFWPGQYLEARAQPGMSDEGASGNPAESSEVPVVPLVVGFVLGLLAASVLLHFLRRKSSAH